MHCTGAKVEYPEGDYSFFSASPSGARANTTIHNGVRPAGLRVGPTNYANVTYDVTTPLTTIVHVFHGPTYAVNNLTISETQYGVTIEAVVNDKAYKIAVATISKSTSRDVNPTMERRYHTGHSGYATVWEGDTTRYFGFDNKAMQLGRNLFIRQYRDRGKLTRDELLALPRGMSFTSSFDKVANFPRTRVDGQMLETSQALATNYTNVTSTVVGKNVNLALTSTLRQLRPMPDKDGWRISLVGFVILLAIFVARRAHISSNRDGMRRGAR